MTRMQYRIAAFVLGAIVSAATASKGAPLAFTWNPAAASPALAGTAFTADTIFAKGVLTDVGQPDGTGLTHAIEIVTGFVLGGVPVSPTGFGSAYGLYFESTDRHTFGAPPEVIRFSSNDTVLKADPGSRNGAAFATVAGPAFANAGPTGPADDVTLATGSLVSSRTSLDVVSGILDARVVRTFQPAALETGFFVSPALNGSVLLDGFSSNPANFTVTPLPDGTSITVFEGFTSSVHLVPEPGSILLLLTGVMGVLKRASRCSADRARPRRGGLPLAG